MSSFKNAVKGLRRTHKERSQPFARRRLGLLEKHKDYVLRARNFHQKKNTLKLLREKAQNKNPDEFYYKMINSKVKDGEHFYLDKNEEIGKEEKKLLMTQDMKYVLMKVQVEKKKVERLQSELHLTRGAEKPKLHVVFDDSDTEDEKSGEDGSLRQAPPSDPDPQDQAHSYQELEARRRRLKELEAAAAKMQTKKNLMTDKRPHSYDKKHKVYKWKKERTR